METNAVEFFKKNELSLDNGPALLVLAAWRLKNPENIGKLIRLGHNVGAAEVIFVKEDENYRLAKIRKTAGFSFDQMKWRFVSEEEFMYDVLPNFTLAVVETCNGAQNLFTVKIPTNCLLLAGSESHGIPPHIIAKTEHRFYIPMHGGCKSMNISNALSVAAFEWLRQRHYSG